MLHQGLYSFFKKIHTGSLQGVDKKRFLQKVKILRNLYIHGPASNSEIGLRLNISLPTTINLTEELLESGVVEKKGQGTSFGGRKPALYGLKSSSFYSLGIHTGRFKTRIAVYDCNNQLMSDIVSFRGDYSKKTEFINELFFKASELVDKSEVDRGKLLCVGMVMPGLINSETGTNLTHLNFGDKPVSDVLAEKFNLPVFIENDAKAAAYEELRFGKAKGRKDVLVIYMEWGLGLGIIINGKIYRGALGFAGELSHIPAVDNKIYCQCGKQGCLETIASGAAISRMAKEGIASGKMSVLGTRINDEAGEIDAQAVVDAANSGDLFAISILSEVGGNLGRELASLMQLFNPEIIILSGKICEAEQYITTPVRQALNTYCMPQVRENTDVVISGTGSHNGIVGAVAMAVEQVFDKPNMVRIIEQFKPESNSGKKVSK